MRRLNLSSISLAFVSLICPVRGISCLSVSQEALLPGDWVDSSLSVEFLGVLLCSDADDSHCPISPDLVPVLCLNASQISTLSVCRTVASYLRPFNVLLVEKAEFSLWGSISFVQHGPNVRSFLSHRRMLADMESCWRSSAEEFLCFVRRSRQ